MQKLVNYEELLEKIKDDVTKNVILNHLDSEFGEQVRELLSFNEYNIEEKLKNNAYIQEQFRLKYITEEYKRKTLELTISEKLGIKYETFKTGNLNLTKTEIERYYLPKDEEIVKLKKLLIAQETKVAYFAMLCDVFKTQAINLNVFAKELRR